MSPEEKKRTRIIQKTLESVVSISALQDIRELGKKHPAALFPFYNSDREKRNTLLKKLNGSMIDYGGGSGFIVSPTGIIATNTHVICRPDLNYSVTLYDNSTYPAKLLGTDEIHDIAFLKIEGKKFPYIDLGDSSTVVLGQTVYAIGNALGYFRNTVSSGIISGLTRSIEAMNEERKEELHGLLQTDAAINPGNSGGPLIDSDGRVIGINSAAVSQAENIAFAIPINAIKNNLSDILECGKIRRAYLGVRHVFVNDRIKKAFGLSTDYGIWVMSPTPKDPAVIPDSPAAKAGVRERDIISEIDGSRIDETHTLEEFLEDAKGGQRVTLTILRKKRTLRLTAVLSERA